MRRMPAKIPARQLGLTMFELTMTIALGSLLLVATLPFQIERLEQTQVEVSAAQVFTVGDLAQQHRLELGVWPGEATNCPIADVMTDLVAGNYLVASIDTTAWGSAITTTCTPGRFDVSTDGPNTQRAQEAASRLHTATVAGQTITSTFPAGGPPAFGQVLHRVVIAGQPELNRMETAIDMNGQNLDGAATVTTDSLVVNTTASIPVVTGDTSLCAGSDAGCNTSMGGGDTWVSSRADDHSEIIIRGGADRQLLISNYDSPTGPFGSVHADDLELEGEAFWATRSSQLSSAQGGSIELGGRDSVAGGGTPYIDFHFNGRVEDYNVRFINSGNRTMTMSGSGGNLASLVVEGDGIYTNNVEVVGDLAVRDMVSSVSQKAASQAVHTMTIVPPETLIPVPTYCATLGQVPKIYTAAASFAEGPTATPIYQVRTYAVRQGDNWLVKMSLLTENGLINSPPADYNSIQVATKCEVS